jgi:hypothetical protein
MSDYQFLKKDCALAFQSVLQVPRCLEKNVVSETQRVKLRSSGIAQILHTPAVTLELDTANMRYFIFSSPV